YRFLLQSLEDLDSRLRKLNSRLFVIRGQPTDIFPKLFQKWDISALAFEEDPEPFGKERDSAVCTKSQDAGIEVIIKTSHTLFNLQKILDKNSGVPPLTYKRFQRILARMDPPPRPVEAVTSVTIGSVVTPINSDHDDQYG
ncbi:hypothetical protein CAPTEDRAFT_40617, partial [Capitella teleta]